MTIATYADLKTAVGAWLNRTDLTANIVDFVTLAEARLNRTLTALQMETTAAVTLAAAASTAALPSRFLKLIDLYYDSDSSHPEQVTPEYRQRAYATGTGRPEAFAVSDQFLFTNPADQAYALTCRYRKALAIASDSTNWVLTNHPGAYLFAALAEAEPFLTNDARAAGWEAKARREIDEINALDARTRSRAPLRADAGLLAAGRYNVYTDA